MKRTLPTGSALLRWMPLILLGGALFLVREVLAPFLIGGVIAYLASGLIEAVQPRITGRLNRTILTFAVFGLLYGAGLWGLTVLTQWLIREGELLIRAGPALIQQALATLSLWFPDLAQDIPPTAVLESWVRSQAGTLNPFVVARSVGNSALEVMIALTSSIYLVISGPAFVRGLILTFPPRARPEVRLILAGINHILRRYLVAQIVLVAWVSLMMWLGLAFLFRLPYAAALALATGILELIPFVGPVLAATIGVIVGLGTHGADVPYLLGLIAFYTVVRQVEDQLVMPLVYGRSIELPAAVTLLAVIAGGHLGGPIGMVFAVPAVASGLVVLRHLIRLRDELEERSIRVPGAPAKTSVWAKRTYRLALAKKRPRRRLARSASPVARPE